MSLLFKFRCGVTCRSFSYSLCRPGNRRISKEQLDLHSRFLIHVHRHVSNSRPMLTGEKPESKETVTKVLYDGECKICTVEINMLKRWARQKPVEFTDISLNEYDPRLYSDVSYEEAMKEMHVIAPDGKVLTQGDAIRHMYRACGLGWLATLTELSFTKPTCDRLYVRFAEYRLRKALEQCDNGSCSIKLHQLREKLNKTES